MSTSTWIRLGSVVAVLVLLIWAWGVHRQAVLQGEIIKLQAESIEQLQQSVEQVLAHSERASEQMGYLLSMQSEVRVLSAGQIEQTRSIQREKDVQPWADTVLPAAVQRLRSRPAIIGADGYRQRLRSGDAVRAESEQRNDERGSEPAD